MRKESKEFLFELLHTPSPTGYEQRIQRVVRKYVQDFSDSVEVDLHGNLVAALRPAEQRRVMLAGHCDQIGFMVTNISKDGFIHLATLGGIDTTVLHGSAVTIHTDKGAVQGVFGKKPIHLLTEEERGRTKVDIDKTWVDIGAKDQREAGKMVAIGDPVTFRLGVTEMPHGRICSPGLDDKVGLFVAMEALRHCSEAKKLVVGVSSVSTVQEEVGLRGAHTSTYSVNPEVGIAIDVVFSTDNPGNENPRVAPVKLGGGPTLSRGPNTNPIVDKMLVAAAKKGKIPYQPTTSNRPAGNDSNAMQLTRGGVATATLGIPNRYMHTQVEMCQLDDLENGAKLLARFIQEIGTKTDFRPV